MPVTPPSQATPGGGFHEYSIFTTNYDRIIEEFCGSMTSFEIRDGFSYNAKAGRNFWNAHSFDVPINPNTNTIKLHKLHGSLNWKLSPDGIERVSPEIRITQPKPMLIKDMLLYPGTKERPDQELKRLAANKSALALGLSAAPVNLLDGECKKSFLERARSLGNLQNRYWSRFLDPQCVVLLIGLEQLLTQLDTKIVIVKREREAERNGTLKPISRELAKINIDQLYEILQQIMRLLADGVDQNLIKMM